MNSGRQTVVVQQGSSINSGRQTVVIQQGSSMNSGRPTVDLVKLRVFMHGCECMV